MKRIALLLAALLTSAIADDAEVIRIGMIVVGGGLALVFRSKDDDGEDEVEDDA